MYITQSNYFNDNQKSQQKSSKQIVNKNKQILLSINDLHQYVSSIFVGCSLPPLNQFLVLDIQNDQIRVKLESYKSIINDDLDPHNYIFFLESGKILLKKKDSREIQIESPNKNTRQIISASSILTSTRFVKKQSSNKQKVLQVKQNNFFMLFSFRKITDLQNYQLIGHQNNQYGRCKIGKIKINQEHSLSWYLAQSEKYKFLSSIFHNQSSSISQHKLKGLSRFFKYQKFRRRALLTQEGLQNNKLIIVKSGQFHYSKSFTYDQKNHSNIKTIKVAVGEPRTALGAQFILFDCFGSSKNALIVTKALNQIQKQNPKLKFKLFTKNKSNFTAAVVSSHADVYYIEISKFKELCQKYVPQAPQILRKNIQSNYITLLRATKQKLHLQLSKIQRNQKTSTEKKTLVQCKIESGQFDMDEFLQNMQEQFKSPSPIKVKKSQLIQTNLQIPEVQKLRSNRLTKKIEIVLQSNKRKYDYKRKIQDILKSKLGQQRFTPSPLQQNTQPKQCQKENKQIVQDLQQIFMNNENAYRSGSINRQSQLLQKKQILLKKRYSSLNNQLIVHQECYDKKKNKLFRVDLIKRGIINKQQIKSTQPKLTLEAKNFSTRIKEQCTQKINKANKIKQQFMTIRSQCQNCHCYDNIDNYSSVPVQKDLKSQTMRTGLAWRPAQTKNQLYQESLEKLHSRAKLISQKSSRKYQHNAHLHSKSKTFAQRRMSAPLL